MKKFLYISGLLMLTTTQFLSAVNMVAKKPVTKYTSTADILCTAFVCLGVALITIFGTKSIIHTFKNKQD
jgi:hypothetical protein